jgi:predicted RNase H-like HicB family nuclease
VSRVAEIIFRVEPCAETGGYVARWDAPEGGGITTQGDSFAELDAMITDAVGGYFEPEQRPKSVRLHFAEDPVLAVA